MHNNLLGQKHLFLVFTLFLFVSLPLVIAQPARSVTTTEYGIQIEYPLRETFQTNQTYSFHFHLFNGNNSLPYESTDSMTCVFHLYNSTGSHLVKIPHMETDDMYDWEAKIQGENFSYPGEYSFVVQCNNTNEGGFLQYSFKATNTGEELDSTRFNTRLFWVLLIMGVVLIGIGMLVGVAALGFFGSISLLLAGMYTMIYGFEGIINLYTRGIAGILLGLGLIFVVVSVYESLKEK